MGIYGSPPLGDPTQKEVERARQMVDAVSRKFGVDPGGVRIIIHRPSLRQRIGYFVAGFVVCLVAEFVALIVAASVFPVRHP